MALTGFESSYQSDHCPAMHRDGFDTSFLMLGLRAKASSLGREAAL